MTENDSESRRHVTEQHNHGDGAFVGGDNHGEIHIEAVDAVTKGLLRDISSSSPALARLLEKAMDDGLISAETAGLLAVVARSINEDVAEMLMSAARNINEDVAGLLVHASRSINEDVAGLFTHASHSINEDVAGHLSHAADTFDKASQRLDLGDFNKIVGRVEGATNSGNGIVDDLESLVVRLEESLNSLERLAGGMESLQSRDKPLGRIEEIGRALNGAAARIEATVTPPPPKILLDHKARNAAFLWGCGFGAFLVFYLVNR
ncbi:hypothetical protein [Streptomyces goshikiensis]|uniref:hypothetical protein n=1 Tax=Streptomyces goshikiensis TaxID=1942 RepID=UPI002AE0A740|nr:hypothetical protein [Streptomyces goshikiensis]